ncbi:MAG: NUDIX domain-containing protein [Bradyrhizobiaceae bacterium]|nr:NUDIX domain-containing protein [Bradyrhizobiaceae bacterium]
MDKGKSRIPILAAGGIVLRNDLDFSARFAIVQSRKLDTWGLPKGKLAAGEDALTAARREVLEETGHRVSVHEFLGTLVYETNSRPKVVQFWRMQAAGAPDSVLMRDVKAVDWLRLGAAIDRLSHLRERVFLQQVGPIALKLCGHPTADAYPQEGFEREMPEEETRRILASGVAPSPDDEDHATRPFDWRFAALIRQAHAGQSADDKQRAEDNERRSAAPAEAACGARRLNSGHHGARTASGKSFMRKTWGWLCHAAVSHRQPFD